MKRFLILAIIVLMAFAVGCSKRETPTQPVQKIEPTPEVTFGTVRVATIPDSAVVIFDGRNYGPAPVSIDSLAPAPYTYKILSPDTAHIDSAEAFYEVKAGTNSLMVRLKIKSLVPLVHIDTVFVDTSRVDTVVVEPPDTTTKTGYLVVNHNETTAGAGVWVDGSFAGWLGYPEFRDTLAVGGHNLKVHKEGFQDFATFFEIFENIPTAFNPVLVPIATPVPDSTGRLTLLLVRPEMAYYEVKGQEKTWTGTLQKNVPVHIDSVPVGDYTVSASADGYLGFLETRKVGPENWTHDFRIQLDPEIPTPPPPPPPMSKKVLSWDVTNQDATLKFDGSFYSLHETYVEVDSASTHRLLVTAGPCWSVFDTTFIAVENIHFNITLKKVLFKSDGRYIRITKSYLDQNIIYSSDEDPYGFDGLVFDGSTHNLFYVDKSQMTKKRDVYEWDLNQLPYCDYSQVTFYKQGSWFSSNLHCVPDTNGVWLENSEWFGFKWDAREIPQPPAETGKWYRVYVSPTNSNVTADGILIQAETVYETEKNSIFFEASAEGYVTEGRTEQMVEGDTVEVRFELDEEPPAPTPLMIEAVGDTVRLYGDGHGSWLGLECYFPAQDSTTGWYNNLWVRGQDRGEYTEFNVPAPYSHCVLWTSAVAGMEGSGGSGVPPRFAEWNLLQKGSGISRINTDPGYFVIQGR